MAARSAMSGLAELTLSKRRVTSSDGFAVNNVVAIAIGKVKRKPGVAKWMSQIWNGPPVKIPQIDAITVPDKIDASAPQTLNRRPIQGEYRYWAECGTHTAPCVRDQVEDRFRMKDREHSRSATDDH